MQDFIFSIHFFTFVYSKKTTFMKKIIFALLIILPHLVFSQKQGNIWYFGNHAGLDFNYNPPVPLLNGATYNSTYVGWGTHSEGTSVICDSSGSLLFYTNGKKVWNNIHQLMPNGDSLLGHPSSTQSALIVPQPGSSRYFYIFTTDAFVEDSLRYGFRYSVVDICNDNGLGDVDKGRKNIKLLDTVAEKLTTIRHSNGTDYWIITHKYFSDAFYAYHLSSIGIIDTVVSHIGSVHPTGTTVLFAAIGQLKASPDGNKLVIVNGNSSTSIAEYFDFNKTTGIISNCVNIQTNLLYSYYGASFSTDNSKIYISSWLNGQGIYQFDLNAGNGNQDSVRASKIRISNGLHNYFGLQLADNGKIYASTTAGSSPYISVINFPNLPGLSCNCVDSAIYLIGGSCSYSFPNFIDSYDYSNTSFDCTTVSEESYHKTQYNIYPNPVIDYLTIEGMENNAKIEVYDLSGKLLLTKQLNENHLDIRQLAKGLYFIKLSTKEGSVVRKFVKE
jgi:hypothetical protein